MKHELTKYKKLKQRLQKLGIVIPGTLRVVYQRCGKNNCACASGKDENLHGPYIYWDRKVDGRLSSMSVQKDDKKLFQEWINNRKQLEVIVKEMHNLGLKIGTQRKRS